MRNRQTEYEIECLIERALRSGYAILPKWKLQNLYSKTKLTSTIFEDLSERAVNHNTVEDPSELLVFAFRERDEARDVLLVRADRILHVGSDEYEISQNSNDVEETTE